MESKAILPAVTGVIEIELGGEDTADTAVVRAEWARESGERVCARGSEEIIPVYRRQLWCMLCPGPNTMCGMSS